MSLFHKVKAKEGFIDVNDAVEIVRNVYPDIPRGSISRVNNIQFNYFGQGDHAYYVLWNEQNIIFHRNELKLRL